MSQGSKLKTEKHGFRILKNDLDQTNTTLLKESTPISKSTKRTALRQSILSTWMDVNTCQNVCIASHFITMSSYLSCQKKEWRRWHGLKRAWRWLEGGPEGRFEFWFNSALQSCWTKTKFEISKFDFSRQNSDFCKDWTWQCKDLWGDLPIFAFCRA